MKKNQLVLGAHMSIAGGYEQAIIRAEVIGCTALQIFTKSNRQWAAKPLTAEQAQLFKKTLQESSTIKSTMVHASYLINLGSTDKAIAQKSVAGLIEELRRCQALEIPFLVLHPGAYAHSTLIESMSLISQNLNYIFEHDAGTTMILLENSAGQGSSVGSTFEELRTIYDGVENKKRIGFCFDTCHGFAAGYDFRTPTTYEALWKHFDDILGLKNLKAFHFNDSSKDLNCHVDRHAHIGKGKIGLEAFSLLMNDHRFFSIPKILETPKVTENLEQDFVNLTTLKNLLSKETKELLHIEE